MSRDTPAYDLRLLQQLIGQGPITRMITHAAREGGAPLGFDEGGIVEAVLALTPAHFYKSMEAEKWPGLWQDVYRMEYEGIELYIKLQRIPEGRAVVVQFKER